MRPQSGWANNTETGQLTISGTNLTLGQSVAMDSSGQTIIAGQPGTDLNTRAGAAYVFVKPNGGWVTTSTATAALTASPASNPPNVDHFGHSVSISSDGTTVVIGAPNHGHGAAYVFVSPSAPAGWVSNTQNVILASSNGQNGDLFGDSTSTNKTGTTVVVGAPQLPAGPGEAYVFQVPAGGWTGPPQNEVQILTAFSGADIFNNQIAPLCCFGGGGTFNDAGGVSISGNGSALAIGGTSTIMGTRNQDVWLFH